MKVTSKRPKGSTEQKHTSTGPAESRDVVGRHGKSCKCLSLLESAASSGLRPCKVKGAGEVEVQEQ